MDYRNITQRALKELLTRGASEARAKMTYTEKHELTLDDADLSMLRTTFDTNLGLEYVKNLKRSQLTVNQIDDGEIAAAATRCAQLCESGRPDETNRLAPLQQAEKFANGAAEPDIESMCDRLKEFADEVKKTFPTVILRDAVLVFKKAVEIDLNSNGVDFETMNSFYQFSAIFLAKDKGKTSSFNYTDFMTQDIGTPILNQGILRILLGQIVEQLEPRQISGSFSGDIIVAPDCLLGFLDDSLAPITDFPLMSGTSIYREKLGQKIAATGFNLEFLPAGPDCAYKEFITSDGFKSENLQVIENGILKSFLQTFRGSLKTHLGRAGNYGNNGYCVAPGDTSLEDMVKGVKKGILLCRFSGDSPNENGDFSGVAKNSYYIEDGKIRYPVSELMISGNTAQFLLNIGDISRDRINTGYSLLPWIKSTGITISGK